MIVFLKALGAGLLMAIRRIRLVVLFFLLNLAVALLLSVPFWREIQTTFAHSQTGVNLVERFDREAVTDFFSNNELALGTAFRGLRYGAIAYLFLGIILLGGILSILADPKTRTNMLTFCAGCGRYIWTFLRAEIILAALLVALWLLNIGFSKALIWIFDDWLAYSASSPAIGWTLFGKNIVMLLLFAIVLQAVGFAKIRAVVDGERGMVRGIWRGFGLIGRHPLATNVFLASIVLLLGLVVSLYVTVRSMLVHGSIQIGTLGTIPNYICYIGVVVLTMLLIHLVLVARYAGQIHIYRTFTGNRHIPGPASGPPPDFDKDSSPSQIGRIGRGIVLFLGAGAALLASDARAQQIGPTNNAYHIQVRIDPEQMQVSGLAKVTFINHSQVNVTEIPFHLYPNAFRGLDSAWAREAIRSRGAAPRMGSDPDRLGFMRIEAIQRDDGTDLREATQIEETRMQVRLDPPVPPGESVTLDIRFSTKLPEIVARMGYSGPDINLMQWYPKMGVFRDGEWICHPFHAMGEFYSDFGTYDVTITMPTGYRCGATGQRVDLSSSSEMTQDSGERDFETITYHAERVHDFAFAASPNYQIIENQGPGGVTMTYLCQPYAVPKADTVLDTVRRCLELYGDWIMPYPYSQIVVDGEDWGRAGGMEYPNLFTISQLFPNHAPWLDKIAEDPVGVTVHEFSHQYWYGILASDEVEDPWLDEGVTTYMTSKILDEIFGTGEDVDLLAPLESDLILVPFLNQTFGARVNVHFRAAGIDIGPIEIGPRPFVGFPESPFERGDDTWLGFRLPNLRSPGSDQKRWVRSKLEAMHAGPAAPLISAIPEITPGAERGLVYHKAMLALLTVERHVGWEAMRDALREYAGRWAFKHPTSDDFFAVLQEKTPIDVQPLVEELFRKPGVVDFSVALLRSDTTGSNPGYELQQRPGDGIGKHFAETDQALNDATWRSEVVVRNLGDVVLPVDIEFQFADGTTQRQSWDGHGFEVFEFDSSKDAGAPDSRLIAAVIDPDEKFPIDINRNNNGRRIDANTAAVTVLDSWATFWIQSYLAGFSFFW